MTPPIPPRYISHIDARAIIEKYHLKNPWFICGLSVVFILLLGSIVRHGEVFTPTMLNASPAQVFDLQGNITLQGETSPFTGYIIDHYPSGAVKSRVTVDWGLKEGKSETFYPDGTPQAQEFYIANILNGVRKTWHANGKPATETPYTKGKEDGVVQTWYDTGQLAERREMLEGRPEGLKETYYPSGFLKSRARYGSGRQLEQITFQDGEQK